jgi:hypothetical protein
MTETQLGREGKARSRPEPEGSALTAAELALPPCTLLPHTMAVAAVGWQAPFPSPGGPNWTSPYVFQSAFNSPPARLKRDICGPGSVRMRPAGATDASLK